MFVYIIYAIFRIDFLKVLMFRREVHQKSVLFVTIGILLAKGFKFQLDVCNRCHNALMSIYLDDIAILNILSVDYSGIINRISKSEAVNLIWVKKIGTF